MSLVKVAQAAFAPSPPPSFLPGTTAYLTDPGAEDPTEGPGFLPLALFGPGPHAVTVTAVASVASLPPVTGPGSAGQLVLTVALFPAGGSVPVLLDTVQATLPVPSGPGAPQTALTASATVLVPSGAYNVLATAAEVLDAADTVQWSVVARTTAVAQAVSARA